MRGRRLGAGLGVALAATLFVRPLLHDIPLRGVLLFWVFALLYVVAPGVLAVRALRAARRDLLLLLGLGSSVGVALECVAYSASRWLEQPWLFRLFPLPFLLLLALGRGTRTDGDDIPPLPRVAPTALILVVLAVMALTPLASVPQFERPLAPDMLFHTANAAELRQRWPPGDPRVAGESLNYHLLGSALPAGAAEWAGMRTGDATLGLLPMLMVGILAVELVNLGRVATGSGVAALVGAGFFLLSRDPGRWLGVPWLVTRNDLATGIYGSVSTALGFVFLASLGTTIGLWLAARRPRVRLLLPMVLLAIAASGTKGSILPPALAGLVFAVAVRAWSRDRRGVRRAATALVAVAVAGAPLTLQLALGPGSYRGMFALDPLATARLSPLVEAARAHIFGAAAPLPGWAAALLAATWLIAYLGAPLLASLCLLSVPGRGSPIGPWLVGTSVAGMGLALGLVALDQSQLFFAYTGQLTLCVLAGAGLVAAWPRRRWLALAVLALGIPGLWGSARAARMCARDDLAAARFQPGEGARQYVAGLDWLRLRSDPEAVLLSPDRSLLLSAFAERRAFYETGRFTARGHALAARGDLEPFPERARTGFLFFANPTEASLAEVRRILPVSSEVLVVLDEVRFRFDAGLMASEPTAMPAPPLLPTSDFELAFATDTLHVYRPR